MENRIKVLSGENAKLRDALTRRLGKHKLEVLASTLSRGGEGG